MHAAYERLAVASASRAGTAPHDSQQLPLFAQAGLGTFISGHSKAADIEQSLVIGAHGSGSPPVCLPKE